MSQRKTIFLNSFSNGFRLPLMLMTALGACLLASNLDFAQAQKQVGVAPSAPLSETAPTAAPVSNSTVVPATSRQQALFDARRSAGRSDPLAPIDGFKPFPSGSASLESKPEGKEKLAPTQIPAPPNVAGMKLIPPPPPVVNSADELSVSELPLPPDRPSLAAKLRLTGVIGDKAIFAFTDAIAAKVNKWPSVLMMGAGDRFESVETVSVGTDSAVLEEDGERSTKSLERIR